MTVSQKMQWKQDILKLKEYLSKHPEIEVSATGMHIPKQCRVGFNAGIEEARQSIAKKCIG